MAGRRKRTIEGDTVLMPAVVADGVVGEVARGLHEATGVLPEGAAAFVAGEALQRAMADALVDEADETYRTNARFAKAMHADSGRDRLWHWMRVAAARKVLAELGQEAHDALPEGLAEGREPTFGPAPGM